MSIALAPVTTEDEARLLATLSRLAVKDPALRVRNDTDSGKIVVSGTDEAQLDAVLRQVRGEPAARFVCGKPQVCYRETVRMKVREEARFAKEFGGRGQHGHCVLEIEPLPRGRGVEFVNELRFALPGRLLAAAEKGVREALEGGALVPGLPIVDVKVTLVDGSFHQTDSSEMGFRVAGAMALREGCRKALPTLLEPVMRCEVTAPAPFTAEVVADLNGRRAKIHDMGARGEAKLLGFTVPLSQMFGYAERVRALTQGQASFTMTPSHYDEVPEDAQRTIIKAKDVFVAPPAAKPRRPAPKAKKKRKAKGG
jgi:elongation factor G